MIKWVHNYDNTKVTVELGEAFESPSALFDFDYPTYTPEHKTILEQKIFDHYFFRQIGQETPARFKHYLKARLNEIMPYYVKMYQTETLLDGVNVLDNYSLTEIYESTSSGTKNTTTENSGESDTSVTTAGHSNVDTKIDRTEEKTVKESDTPQGSIENLDSYMSSASKDNGTVNDHTETVTADSTTAGTTVTATDTGTASETTGETVSHSLTRTGNIGVMTFADLLKGYRDTFLRLDEEIITNLNDLFLGVY